MNKILLLMFFCSGCAVAQNPKISAPGIDTIPPSARSLRLLDNSTVLVDTSGLSIKSSVLSNKKPYNVLRSYSALRALPAIDTNTVWRLSINKVVSDFVYDPADLTSPDDGVMVIVNGEKRFKRYYEKEINIRWFGAQGNGITDDTPAFLALLKLLSNQVKNRNFSLYIPTGRYRITQTLSTKPGTGHLIIRGDGEGNSQLIWDGAAGQDFIRVVNGWGVKLIDFEMIGKNGPNRPRRMINFYKESTKAQDGAVQECLVENVTLSGQIGEFTDGITWTCSDPGQDENNEQTTIQNCYVRMAKQYAISIEHSNSLWHKIVGGQFSGDSAAINTIAPGGRIGGGFSLQSSVLQTGNFPGGYCFRLGGSFYPYQINDARTETTGKFLYARPNGYYYQVYINGGSFKITSKSDAIIDAVAGSVNDLIQLSSTYLIGNGEAVKLTGNSGANFTARNVYWNVNNMTYSWNIVFDRVNGVAPITQDRLPGGHLSIVNAAAGGFINNYTELGNTANPVLTGSRYYQVKFSNPLTITDFVGGIVGDEFTLYTDHANVSIANNNNFSSPFGSLGFGNAPAYLLPAKSVTRFVRTSPDVENGAHWMVLPQIGANLTAARIRLKKGNQYDDSPLLEVDGTLTASGKSYLNDTIFARRIRNINWAGTGTRVLAVSGAGDINPVSVYKSPELVPITITNGAASTVAVTGGYSGTAVYINPTSVLSNYTLTLPAGVEEGTVVEIHFGGNASRPGQTIVTRLNIVAGSGIIQSSPPTTAVWGDCFSYRFHDKNYYRIK